MELQALMRQLSENLANKATVNTVFGEAITVGEKKIVPVARAGCGFGAGGGSGKGQRGSEAAGPQLGGEGGGGGGGFGVMPIGVVEITPTSTQFIRFGATRRLVGAFALGILFGSVFARRRLRT